MRKHLGTALAVIIAAAAIGTVSPSAAAVDTIIDARTASLTLWHAYGSGTPEEQAFQTVLASVRPKFPNVTFSVVVQLRARRCMLASRPSPPTARTCSSLPMTGSGRRSQPACWRTLPLRCRREWPA